LIFIATFLEFDWIKHDKGVDFLTLCEHLF
jgi:hypothetical protein